MTQSLIFPFSILNLVNLVLHTFLLEVARKLEVHVFVNWPACQA